MSAAAVEDEERDGHAVDLERRMYLIDKGSIVHLPEASYENNIDCLRSCVVFKDSACKLKGAPGLWLVDGAVGGAAEQFEELCLPKLASFVDGREKCVAVFWRHSDEMSEPKVVCLRAPIVTGETVVGDDALSACKLSQISRFEELTNDNGGALLTHFEKYLSESSLFKFAKLSTVKQLRAYISKGNCQSNAKQAFGYLELRRRKEKQTTRVGQRGPRGASGQEDEQTELKRLQDELAAIKAARVSFEEHVMPSYKLPLTQRFLRMNPPPLDGDAAAYLAASEKLREIIRYHPLVDAIDKSPAELERVVRAIAGHTAGEPVLSPLRPPAPPVAVGDGDDDDEEFAQLSDTGEQGESGSQEAGAAAGSAVRASARERAPPARLDLGPSSKTTKGGAGSKSDTRDKENRGGAKRNGRGGKSGPRGRDDLGNPAPLKYARRGANAAIPADIGQHSPADPDNKKLKKALDDLAAAKLEVAELKMRNATLTAKLELKEKELEQEQATKATQIELAASKATLEAQKDLSTQLSEAYTNGLKFAQSAYATFASQRGPPSSSFRSSSSRLSHSSGDD